MFCTNCGNQLRDGAAFCPQCGTRTAAQASAASSADPELSDLLARADLLVAEDAAQAAPPQNAPAVPPVPPVAPSPQPVAPPPQPVYYAAPAAVEPPKKKSRAGLIVLCAILAAILMAVAAFLSWKFFLADDRGGTSQNDADTDRDEKTDEDGEQTDPEAEADSAPDADAEPEGEDDPAGSGSTDASDDTVKPEAPAEPEGPSEEELLTEAEACITAGFYEDAIALLAQVTEPSDREHFDMLFTAATLNPELTSVDVGEFPTIRIELHYSSTLFFANEIILTEDGMPLTIDSMEQNDTTGIAVYTCTAAPGEARSLQRTIGVQIVFDSFTMTAETNYQTPALVSRYELFFADVSWEEAVAECEAMGGHLITITSGEEMGIAVDLASSNDASYTWLGGYTTVTSDGITAHWITGEPMDYQLWALGEPSGSDRDGTVENCMMLWNVPSLGGWSWNDQRPDPVGDGFYAGEIAFICEWEEYQS